MIFHHKILVQNTLSDTNCEVELIFTAIYNSANEKELESTNVVLGHTDYCMLTQLCLYPSQSLRLKVWLHDYLSYRVFTDYRISQQYNINVDSVAEYMHPMEVKCWQCFSDISCLSLQCKHEKCK
jgi:hypothetical protein